MTPLDRFRGCLLGLAVGDAVGTAVELMPRGSFPPVVDMVGGGPFNLKPGEWTDDTSMALCLAASLAECGRFDPSDQMGRYARWLETGYMSSNGRVFDCGLTTARAIQGFRETGSPFSGPTSPGSAGNGCIMRLAPVPMFCHPDRDRTIELCAESARTTHGAEECLDACRLLGDILFGALSGWSKEEVLGATFPPDLRSPRVREIAERRYQGKPWDGVRGSGYVVESLEAALWCFWRTDSYRSAILTAASLGDDADTTAAVCGQVAGAFYGESGIPAQWLDRLARRGEIGALAEALMRAG